MRTKLLIIGSQSDVAAEVKLQCKSAEIYCVARGIGNTSPNQGTHNFECQDLSCEHSFKALINLFKEKDLKFDHILMTCGSHGVMPLRVAKKQHFEKIFQDNFFPAVNLFRYLPSISKPGSKVLLLSSAVTIRGSTGVGAYAASKAALESLTKTASLEFAANKITVNALAPGTFKSKMSDEFFKKISEEQKLNLEASYPLGFANASEIASTIIALFSSNLRWMTGQTIVIDGGYSING